jgi:hypothetical protein
MIDTTTPASAGVFVDATRQQPKTRQATQSGPALLVRYRPRQAIFRRRDLHRIILAHKKSPGTGAASHRQAPNKNS